MLKALSKKEIVSILRILLILLRNLFLPLFEGYFILLMIILLLVGLAGFLLSLQALGFTPLVSPIIEWAISVFPAAQRIEISSNNLELVSNLIIFSGAISWILGIGARAIYKFFLKKEYSFLNRRRHTIFLLISITVIDFVLFIPSFVVKTPPEGLFSIMLALGITLILIFSAALILFSIIILIEKIYAKIDKKLNKISDSAL